MESEKEGGGSQQSIPSVSKKEDNPEVKMTSDLKNPQAKVVRGTKKMRIDSSDSTQPPDKKESKEDDSDTKNVRSMKRSCELWSLEDKNTFFKALNEYGKDFDALQLYFLSQGKKKGLPDNMIKNKEQIRHFYYRTWLKISKHLKFSEDVKKASQEIYGLTNYGELRRKLPRIHDKVVLKLNELIYWGSTQVRLRGKTMRIKTPICRALRKLNQLEDWQEDIKLPPRVTIELRPGNNSTWWQVQAHAMNPRVRTLLPIQRRLSSLLGFLQQRWKPVKYQSCVDADSSVFDDFKDKRLLRVAPPKSSKIALPMVNLGEYLTSNSVSFNSYEKRLGLRTSKLELLGSVQQLKSVGKKSIKKKTDKRSSNKCDDATNTDNNSDLDGLEGNLGVEKNSFANPCEGPSAETSAEFNRFPGRETVDRIRQGWTLDEANSMTVGDLFLMFGRDSKITLEYWWETSANVNDKGPDNSLCLSLKKLLSIAKHHYGSSKVYDNLSSNETVVSSRVPSAKESTFRRPLMPQACHKIGSQDAFKTQLDKFTSRFCKRTVRQRSLIVQRPTPSFNPTQGIQNNNNTVQPMKEVEEKETSMELDLTQGEDNFLNNLVSESANPSNSIITSATQILKEGEGQWFNSEVADYSLSSFLGPFESPIKGSQRSQIDDTRPSSDVVSQMQCLMGESSVDYMAKFANLASQIASDE